VSVLWLGQTVPVAQALLQLSSAVLCPCLVGQIPGVGDNFLYFDFLLAFAAALDLPTYLAKK